MILRWLADRFGYQRRRGEYELGHPIRRSRELVTEARLREYRGKRMIREARAQRTGHLLGDQLQGATPDQGERPCR